MTYEIVFTSRAARELRKLDPPVRKRLAPAIDALAEDPRPPGSKALKGSDLWRIRVGDWRIVYAIDDDRIVVTVVRVRHRREAY